MGQQVPEPMAATALTLGGIPVKSGPLTIGLACLALAAWVTVGTVLAIGAENRWIVATVGAASSLFVATVASKAVEVIGFMLAQHADRMQAITEAHGKQMRDQVLTLNWMATSRGWGEERAKIEAKHLYGHAPNDSGPFNIVNGGKG